MLKDPVENLENMYEQMSDFGGQMENMRKDTVKMLEMKSILKENKNTFDRLTSRLNTAEENISECKDRSKEITQTESEREERVTRFVFFFQQQRQQQQQTVHPRPMGQYASV